MEYTFIVTCTIYYGKKNYECYGMALIVECERGIEIIKEYSSLTFDKSKITGLVKLCNEFKISEMNLDEVVDDFINGEY